MRDDTRLFHQAYENLAPGGYFEIQSMEPLTTSDDGTHKNAKTLVRMHEAFYDAAEKFGKRVLLSPTWKEKMTDVGFEDVKDVTYKVSSAEHSINLWCSHCQLKQVLPMTAPSESLAKGP